MALLKKDTRTIEKPYDIGVWRIEESLEELLEIVELSEKEKEIFDTFTSERRKREWLSVRALFRDMLHGEEILYNERKPFLRKRNENISISHCKDYSAVLVTSNGVPAGIDIQPVMAEKLDRIHHKFINEEERSLIEKMPVSRKSNVLNLIWAAKETLYKASDAVDFQKEMTITDLPESDHGRLSGWIHPTDNGKDRRIMLEFNYFKEHHLVYTIGEIT